MDTMKKIAIVTVIALLLAAPAAARTPAAQRMPERDRPAVVGDAPVPPDQRGPHDNVPGDAAPGGNLPGGDKQEALPPGSDAGIGTTVPQ